MPPTDLQSNIEKKARIQEAIDFIVVKISIQAHFIIDTNDCEREYTR